MGSITMDRKYTAGRQKQMRKITLAFKSLSKKRTLCIFAWSVDDLNAVEENNLTPYCSWIFKALRFVR